MIISIFCDMYYLSSCHVVSGFKRPLDHDRNTPINKKDKKDNQ